MSGSTAVDLSQPFKLERTKFRGRYVKLGSVIDRILNRQAYPEPVSRLLGELLVLASAFAGSLKFDGKFSLQVRGDGPIRLMVADCTNDGVMRGYASFADDQLDTATDVGLFGQAVLAITVDQSAAGSDTYQGIVNVDPRGLTASVRGYFGQSEQIPTGLRLATGVEQNDGAWNGAALLVQAMPDDSVDANLETSASDGIGDDWRRTMVLMETVTDDELLDRSNAATQLLWRLFHEDGVRVFEPLTLMDGCRCSTERVETVLHSFSPEEVLEMRAEDGGILVTCEFCGQEYKFDQAYVGQLIAKRSH